MENEREPEMRIQILDRRRREKVESESGENGGQAIATRVEWLLSTVTFHFPLILRVTCAVGLFG